MKLGFKKLGKMFQALFLSFSPFWPILIFDFFFKNRKKNISSEKNPPFTLPTHLMTSLSPHLEKFLKFVKWRFFAFFSKKNLKFYIFFIYLVEIWLVQLKLKFLVSCHSQIGLILTKNGKKKIGHFGPQMAQNQGFSNFFA